LESRQNPTYQGDEKRATPRLPPDRRLFVSLNGDSVRIADISMGGITLHGPQVAVGTRVQLDMHLGKTHLCAEVEILRCSEEMRSHGRFVGLNEQQTAALRRYTEETAARPGDPAKSA